MRTLSDRSEEIGYCRGAGEAWIVDDKSHVVVLFFFFQAEDGIRDVAVTGVQTCALPILPGIFGQINLNTYHAYQYGVAWNHTFGPTSVLSVQFGRNYGFSANPTLLPEAISQALIKAGGYDNSFACSFVKGTRNCYFNAVNFSDSGDITSFQEGSSPAVVSDIWQWKGNFAKTHGRHTFSMGADFNTNGFQQTFNTNHLDFSAAQTANSRSEEHTSELQSRLHLVCRLL